MQISCPAIIDGKFPKQFGKLGTQFDKNNIPTRSFPINILNPPEKTCCFALFCEDRDAIPVCGYSWIHWVATNIKRTENYTQILENASITANFIQGVNSSCGKIVQIDKKEAIGYAGMAPPDKPHSYDLIIFALDKELNIEQGFYANELFHEMKGHVLEQAILSGIYDNK